MTASRHAAPGHAKTAAVNSQECVTGCASS
jgi:hypothetical protein